MCEFQISKKLFNFFILDVHHFDCECKINSEINCLRNALIAYSAYFTGSI